MSKCKFCNIQEDNDYENFESYVRGFDLDEAGAVFEDFSTVLLPKRRLLVSLVFPAFNVPEFARIKVNYCPICGRKL